MGDPSVSMATIVEDSQQRGAEEEEQGSGEDMDAGEEEEEYIATTRQETRAVIGESTEPTHSVAVDTLAATAQPDASAPAPAVVDTALCERQQRHRQTGKKHRPGSNNPMTTESMTISMTLSMAMSRPLECLTIQEEEAIRRSYLAIIQRSTWRAELLDIAHSIVLTTPMETCEEVPEPEEHWSVSIKYQGQVQTLGSMIATVGRNPNNDILLNEKSLGSSRLHCVIFALPEKRRLLVADVGSCAGVQLTERSGPEKLSSSLPKRRKPILLQWGETAVLKLAEETLVINPKECVICCVETREVRFACGHFVCCRACSKSLGGNCPICRKQHGMAVATDGARTMALRPELGNKPAAIEDPKMWDSVAVMRWLRKQKVSEDTRDAFEKNLVHGEALLSLSDGGLEALVGSEEEKRCLWREIDILRQQSIMQLRQVRGDARTFRRFPSGV